MGKEIFRLAIIISIICSFMVGVAETHLNEMETTQPEWVEIPHPTIAEFDAAYAREHIRDETIIAENDAAQPVEPEVHICEAIITAYCSCAKCCGRWAVNRPNGVVYTSTGTVATVGTTIAVDPKIIPYGSHVIIDDHEYVAQDTGSGLRGPTPHIDIYCDSHQAALQIGRSTKTITWWEG